MLSRLTLVTANGICNRLRTIAAARRLCAQFNAQCRIVWTWGKFDDFFAKPTDIVFISDSSDESHEIIKHTPSFKSVDVSMSDVIVYSVYIFYGSHEKPIDYLDIKNVSVRGTAWDNGTKAGNGGDGLRFRLIDAWHPVWL
jgi:hypothetical protein